MKTFSELKKDKKYRKFMKWIKDGQPPKSKTIAKQTGIYIKEKKI